MELIKNILLELLALSNKQEVFTAEKAKPTSGSPRGFDQQNSPREG